MELKQGVQAIVLENEYLYVSILPAKGADIYEFVYKPKGVDVLWKSPWGLKKPGHGISTAENTQVAWMEHYAGGWQELFPNAGAECVYKGVRMNFHGELSTVAWEPRIIVNTPDEVAVELTAHTYRSPFRVIRTMSLKKGQRHLEMDESVINLAEEEMDYVWGHHPAFGAPFLDEGMIIQLPPGSWIEADAGESSAARLAPGKRSAWPHAAGRSGATVDLSVLPPKAERSADLAYVGGFAEGWYGITNPKLGFGFGMAWPAELFPYMWFWQELRGSFGYPWYGANYVMAIEPFNCSNAGGLNRCIENGTARRLKPREQIRAKLIAACYESEKGVNRIDTNGNVLIIN